MRGETFSRAFASVATEGWTRACAKGAGAAHAGAEAMAASASAAFASAIARVAARACAACPGCRCAHLPGLGLGLNGAGKWAATFSTFAGGKVGLAKALASASSAICHAGTTNVTKAATEGTMAAVAGLVGAAAGSVRAGAWQLGGGSACAGGLLETQLEVRAWGGGQDVLRLGSACTRARRAARFCQPTHVPARPRRRHRRPQAMKRAGSQVVSDAAATVWGSYCPRAAARLKDVELFTSDAVSRAANRSAEACSGRRGKLFGLPKAADSAQKVVFQMVSSNEPLRRRVTEALTEARRCGCPPSLCLFCGKAERVALPDPLPGPPPPGAANATGAPAKKKGPMSAIAAAAADPEAAVLLKALGYIK